jgi:hypothetical protein
MVPWLLLTIHMIPKIALQFFLGSYDGQQRLLISIYLLVLGFMRFRIV